MVQGVADAAAPLASQKSGAVVLDGKLMPAVGKLDIHRRDALAIAVAPVVRLRLRAKVGTFVAPAHWLEDVL